MSVCRRVHLLLCVWLMWPCVLPHRAWAQVGAVSGERPQVVQVQTVWRTPKAHPGDQNLLAVVVDIQSGYHINPDKAQAPSVGDFIPYPSRLTVVEAAGELSFEAPRFPAPHPIRVEYADGELMSYQGRVILYLSVKVADDTAAGSYRAAIELEYQACTDTVCFTPATVHLPVTLEVVATGADVGQPNTALFADYEQRGNPVSFDLFGHGFSIDATGTTGLGLLLLVAAVGGLLLNLTPCVLPVIPIKIIALSQAAGNRRRCLGLGLVMSLGVLAFWVALGVVIASVSGFQATSELFQKPWFTISVGVFIAVMAVGMCGVFAIRLPRFVQMVNPNHETLGGSFVFGVMTAVLSTPCTAPFMGTALGWATQQQAGISLSTFAAIGTGMALPYVLLSAFPKLVDHMPRTGPASELIKQVMGLLMLSAAAYFVGTGVSGLLFTPPDPPTRLYWWPVMAFVAAAGGWLAYRTVRISPSAARRAIFCSVGVLFVAGGVYGGVRLTGKGPIDWIYYTPQRFEQALAEGNVVVLDFTAEWCLNCKALEHGVLYTSPVVSLVEQGGVVPMKVDITGRNPEGKAKLKEAGRLTIPLLVIYRPDGREVFKSDAYTIRQVVDAIRDARE